MGGIGSGRQGTWATVESCGSVKLDVNRITRDARSRLRDDPGIQDGPRAWSWTSDGEPWARVIITLTMNRLHGTARLQYDVDQRSRPTGPQDQFVRMETTPCRFGGRRWWWGCPVTQRRCGTLYLPNGRTLFSSRLPGAYRLGYASQDGSAVDRINRRLALRRERLGDDSSEGLAASPPDRPKWMRHRTYARLVAEWESTRDQRDEILRRRGDG